MPLCPICSKTVTEDASECPRCHLPSVLFDAVREAVGPPTSDPEYVQELSELILALEDAMPELSPGLPPSPPPPALARAVRFPAPNPPHPSPPRVSRSVLPRGLPALPEGHGPELWRKQIAEYLRLARRQGMDVTDFTERARIAVQTEDPASLEVLNRDLFVHLAARLTDELETLQHRRDELPEGCVTASMDAELEAAEGALAMGDLAGADRRIRQLSDEVARAEEQWTTIQVLREEADLLQETLVELAGDPSPVRGPIEEALRLAREGRRSEAERLLARVNLVLWSLLAPRLTRDLARLKQLLASRPSTGEDTREAAGVLREIATDLRRHNYGELVAAYRKLRTLVDVAPAPATPAPAPEPSGEVAR